VFTYAIRPEGEQARERGVRFSSTNGTVYVPCGIGHKPTVTHAEMELILCSRTPEDFPDLQW
jgi:hypothetical protein